MRFSMNWLRRWVPTELDASAVSDRLTAAGLEVDELSVIGEALDGVVVGEIARCEPHPDADRLQVCQVDHGAEAPATIVCGAPNARAGMKAPLAMPGARLPNGMLIEKARLRGVESSGMLCSAPELGLGHDAGGLLELPATLPSGQPLSEALGLPDQVIEIDLTPNRADCLSLRGIARELSAIEGLACREPSIEPVAVQSEREIEIELLAPDDCPRYVGRVIEAIQRRRRPAGWSIDWSARACGAGDRSSTSPTMSCWSWVSPCTPSI
jgi:phenylalanyl-tRNA synthetase beta chain